ncbi:MAG TPA: type II toxin-antitoxin system RelE/ParE family toxin [Thermoanaerobaculia bacterium]|nr:type II toxin-antitoxin system RelE/ParE family toxin [Thermoanaerobaculia bacterium]
MRVLWSPLAIAKIQREAEYIARDRPMAAERWADGIFESARPLADFPNAGRIVPELARTDVRELIHGGYRLIYRISRDAILILTVRHSRRLLDLAEIETPDETISS